jgi:hypothetical protein
MKNLQNLTKTSDVDQGVSRGYHCFVKGEYFVLSSAVACAFYFIIPHNLIFEKVIT